ncbi:hypothetical protein [Oceanicola sp. S124]|uniref:hypothetical protein n=1 Tax=Oceanicola sp. S124 TaxID=1042378 RepID=UPI000255A94F|nr:hypothetical protein [Oceanicola sp. S124]
MQSTQEIRDLTPEERLKRLDELAEEVFGGTGLVGRVTEALDMTRQNWSRWHREPRMIPAWSILLLQEWALRKRLSADLGRLPGAGARSQTDAPGDQ